MAASDDCIPNTLPVNGISFHTVCLAAAQVPTADRRQHAFKICFTGPLYRRVGDSPNHAVAAPHPHHHNKQSEISETRPALSSSSTDRITIPVSNKLKLKLKLKLKVQCTCSLFPLSAGIAGLTEPGGPHKTTKNFFFFFKHGWIILISRLLVDG